MTLLIKGHVTRQTCYGAVRMYARKKGSMPSSRSWPASECLMKGAPQTRTCPLRGGRLFTKRQLEPPTRKKPRARLAGISPSSICPHGVPHGSVRYTLAQTPDGTTLGATYNPQEEDTIHRSTLMSGYRLRLTPNCLKERFSHRPTIHRLQHLPIACCRLVGCRSA